eukprot:Sdes_comp24392_c0_seq1m22332
MSISVELLTKSVENNVGLDKFKKDVLSHLEDSGVLAKVRQQTAQYSAELLENDKFTSSHSKLKIQEMVLKEVERHLSSYLQETIEKTLQTEEFNSRIIKIIEESILSFDAANSSID